jgi:hypothetical protein
MLLCGLIWGKNREKNHYPKTLAWFSGDFLIQNRKVSIYIGYHHNCGNDSILAR